MKDIKSVIKIEESVHQALLDVGYNEWEKNDWSYSDMVNWVRENYRDISALAIMLGKYNQQVTNGGHIQYYDNGYASNNGNGCMFDYNGDIYLHNEMIELFEELDMRNLKHGERVFDIITRFNVDIDDEEYSDELCSDCGGDGYIEEETQTCACCCGSGYESVYNDNYNQVVNISELNKLDYEYYEICDEWMEELERFFSHLNSTSFTIKNPVTSYLKGNKWKK